MGIYRNGNGTKNNDDFKYEVVEDLGIIGVRELKNGKETIKLRYISWNGRDPKYDIRPWYDDEDGNERCKKPSGLLGEELITLAAIIYNEGKDEVLKEAKRLREGK